MFFTKFFSCFANNTDNNTVDLAAKTTLRPESTLNGNEIDFGQADERTDFERILKLSKDRQ